MTPWNRCRALQPPGFIPAGGRTTGAKFLLSFGYPREPAALTWAKRAGGRKTLDAVVHTERW
jgi:hypothetical protein